MKEDNSKNEQTIRAPYHQESIFKWGDKEYLSLRASAKALGVAANAIKQRVNRKTIKTVDINGRKFIADWVVLKEITKKRKKKAVIMYKFTKIDEKYFRGKFSIQTWRKNDVVDWLATLGSGSFEVTEVPISDFLKNEEQEQEEFLINNGILIHAILYENDKVRITIAANKQYCDIFNYLTEFPICTNTEKFNKIKKIFLKNPHEAILNLR